MYRIFDGTTANYKAKFRELFMNLKNPKNPELRERVVEGHISPARLCQMTSQVPPPRLGILYCSLGRG